ARTEKGETEHDEGEEVIVERHHRTPCHERRIRGARQLAEARSLHQPGDRERADSRRRTDGATDDTPEALAPTAQPGRALDRVVRHAHLLSTPREAEAALPAVDEHRADGL